MHLRTKRIGNQPYLYAVDTYWNAGNPKVAFQTYLGRADQLFGPTAKPLVRTFRYGAVAVLLQRFCQDLWKCLPAGQLRFTRLCPPWPAE